MPRPDGDEAPRPPAEGVNVIRGAAELEDLKDHWDALAAECRHPTQQHDWVVACARSFHADDELHVVVVVRDGRLVAAAPLACTPTGAFEPLGMAQMYEPSDLLYADEEALRTLARALARDGRKVLIRRMPANAASVDALSRAYARRGAVWTRKTAGSPVIPLGHAWAHPEGALSASRRSSMRRARRRAQALGKVTIDLLAPRGTDVEEVLDEAMLVDARSWRAAHGTSLAGDDARGAFMREFARRSADAGRLRIAFLRIDAEPIATQIAIEFNERLWLLKMAYAERFRRCSPGSLLLLESLRSASRRGLEACELLGQVEPWTSAWTQHSADLIGLRASPIGVRLLREVASAAWRRASQRPSERPA